jgi:hypothetical protein
MLSHLCGAAYVMSRLYTAAYMPRRLYIRSRLYAEPRCAGLLM